MARRFISFLLAIAFAADVSGCATLRNTRIPEQFTELGICRNCNKVVAVENLSDDEIAICPECGMSLLVKEAKLKFRKKCVSMKNTKTAVTFFTVALMAASVAGTIYGIPIPFPPICEETFAPYKLPLLISAKRAKRPPLSGPEDYTESPGPYQEGRYASAYYSTVINRIHESAYCLVITDLYYTDNDIEGYRAPYYVSLGRIAGDSYDMEFVSDAYTYPSIIDIVPAIH